MKYYVFFLLFLAGANFMDAQAGSEYYGLTGFGFETDYGKPNFESDLTASWRQRNNMYTRSFIANGTLRVSRRNSSRNFYLNETVINTNCSRQFIEPIDDLGRVDEVSTTFTEVYNYSASDNAFFFTNKNETARNTENVIGLPNSYIA